MHWLDYIIIVIPLLIVVYFAVKSQGYVKGVADFLAAGRVAGRYVLSVASGEAAMGLISVIAIMEMYYKSGFAISFWSSLITPIGLVMGLVGYCSYRFRETKCLTMGQFFEVRYDKSLRVVASVVQATSGIINYAIFPAVGTRFLIYFVDLPLHINILGWRCPTFAVVMLIFLGIALYIACVGGQVTVMVTDCVQGLLSYPMYVLVVAFLLYHFSWSEDIAPRLMARAPHESFLDPYDISNLRDFNLFYVSIGLLSMFFNRMSWGGTQGYFGAARSPHEAKMGAVIGTWRAGFGTMIYILIAICAFAFLNSQRFAEDANKVRYELASKTAEDVLGSEENDELRNTLVANYSKIKPREKFSTTYNTSEEYNKENEDPFIKSTTETLAKVEGKNKEAQTYRTIYNQMLISVSVREILPIGITGMFCALMIFLMISTDTTYMHSWGSIIIQDFVVPLRKKAFEPHSQINALRWAIAGVCLFAFLFSMFFAQVDYILMFFAITGAIWTGAGVVITLGLYWRKGTTAGAFSAIIVGAVMALAGMFMQQIWASHLYPYLESAGMVESVSQFLSTVSAPFSPYIVWEVTPHKFPINSIELSFFALVATFIIYVVVSLLTCKEPFNMERMLHRGIYSVSGVEIVKEKLTLGGFFQRKILGIDEQYTFGDKCLAYSVFIYSFGYTFILCFVVVVIWNVFTPWPIEWWAWYFYVKNIFVALLIGLVSTVWFGICGTRDLFRLFKDLDAKQSDDLDDGRVVGHVSAFEASKQKEK